jgi:transposase
MSFKRAPYPQEFRRRLVELVRSGRTPEELSREFEPSAQSIRNWVAAAALSEDRPATVSSRVEEEELKRLRSENRRLRQERDILAKAAAWFARGTDATPDGSSRS